MDKKKIVILGGGFGGLRAASLISKKIAALKLLNKYEVVLVDRNEHHTYTPLLYEVATMPKEAANMYRLHEVATYNIQSLMEKLPVTVIQAEVVAMDLIEGDIHLSNEKELIADFLVIALGSEMNYFDMEGLKEYSLPLKNFRDAIAIRDSIVNLMGEGKNEINIVIGGGGATGVELAGELTSWCGSTRFTTSGLTRFTADGELKKSLFRFKLNVSLLEGQPTILSGLHPGVISLAEKRLKRLGVKIRTGEKITSASKNNVYLENGKDVPFDLLIWSGGIKSPSILSRLPLHTETHGNPVAGAGMECLPQTPDLKLRSKVYGLGDSICFYNPENGRPIPAVARAAIVQAGVISRNLIEEIKKIEFINYKLKIENYEPKEYPYIVPVGGKYAIAKIGPWIISGFPGWIIKGLVELNYLLSIMPFWKAITIWLNGLKIFVQNDQLG